MTAAGIRPVTGLLAETEDLLAVLDAAVIGYGVTDAEGRLQSASAPFLEIAAVTDNVLATVEPWFLLDHASEEEKALRTAIWESFQAQSEPWKGWVRWHLPSGDIRFFEGTAKRLSDGRVLMIANDRSDRIEADRAVAESDDALRTILNDLPVNVSLVGADGTILYINEVLPRRLGIAVDDVIGRPFDDIGEVSPDPDFSEGLRKAIRAERRIDGVEVRLTKGTLAGTDWLFFGRPLYGRDGKMRQYLSVSVERTAEKRLAKERGRFAAALAETQKISALNDFAGSLAHELANVLQPVGVYARRLVRDPGGPDTVAHAGKIDKAVREAGRILRRTLSMARTDASTVKLVDVAAIVSEVVASARDLAPAALSYEQRTPPAAPALCQPTEFRQVLLNLLNNAAEAQHYAGTVRIEASGPHEAPSDLAVAPTSPGPFLRLDVVDEGHGMDRETKGRIFEPFFTTKTAGRGTGLGLPVVLGLVTGWGGTVTVKSAPGEGSTFSVWIPCGQQAASSQGWGASLDEVTS